MSLETKDRQSIAVFDVCDTLYYSNTTHDFIDFAARRLFSSNKRLLYAIVNDRISLVRYFLIVMSKLTKIDWHKKINVGLLKGLTRHAIENAADRFADEFLETRKIAETHELMRDLEVGGRRIVLCSSSIEPVIKSVAAKLGGKDFLATKLVYENDVCTGEIADELIDRKVAKLNDLQYSRPFSCAVSDNFGDAELLDAAEKKFAVVHGLRGLEFWKNRDVEIIDLRK